MKYLLVKFSWYQGRSGDLEGGFLVNEKNWNYCQGVEWYASEILGKYSEFWGSIDAKDFKVKELTENEVNLLADIFEFDASCLDDIWAYNEDIYVPHVQISGFDILSYIREDSEINKEEDDENADN